MPDVDDIILDDPEALAVFTAVSKHNCRATLHENLEGSHTSKSAPPSTARAMAACC